MAFVPNGLVLIRVRVQTLMPLGRVSFVCVLAWFLYLSTSGVSSPEWQCRAKEPTRSANASLMGLRLLVLRSALLHCASGTASYQYQ